MLEVGKSKFKLLADLVSDESPLPDLQLTVFLLHLYTEEREKSKPFHVYSNKDTNPTHEDTTFMT